jgi:hypothetical protein
MRFLQKILNLTIKENSTATIFAVNYITIFIISVDTAMIPKMIPPVSFLNYIKINILTPLNAVNETFLIPFESSLT